MTDFETGLLIWAIVATVWGIIFTIGVFAEGDMKNKARKEAADYEERFYALVTKGADRKAELTEANEAIDQLRTEQANAAAVSEAITALNKLANGDEVKSTVGETTEDCCCGFPPTGSWTMEFTHK